MRIAVLSMATTWLFNLFDLDVTRGHSEAQFITVQNAVSGTEPDNRVVIRA